MVPCATFHTETGVLRSFTLEMVPYVSSRTERGALRHLSQRRWCLTPLPALQWCPARISVLEWCLVSLRAPEMGHFSYWKVPYATPDTGSGALRHFPHWKWHLRPLFALKVVL